MRSQAKLRLPGGHLGPPTNWNTASNIYGEETQFGFEQLPTSQFTNGSASMVEHDAWELCTTSNVTAIGGLGGDAQVDLLSGLRWTARKGEAQSASYGTY